jgi:hypothetical protein
MNVCGSVLPLAVIWEAAAVNVVPAPPARLGPSSVRKASARTRGAGVDSRKRTVRRSGVSGSEITGSRVVIPSVVIDLIVRARRSRMPAWSRRWSTKALLFLAARTPLPKKKDPARFACASLRAFIIF